MSSDVPHDAKPVASTSTLAAAAPKKVSGVRTVLQYTGIPPSWLDKRPKLPSRNWLIFLSIVGTSVGLYVYDRRECKRIRDEYVSKVAHLAEAPLHSMDLPRKVTVYGAKWPGDEDYKRNMLYFRKYVKPILHAAAVDYDMVIGKKHGDLAELIAEQIKTKRRIAAGLEPPPQSSIPQPVKFSPEEQRRRELAGGLVIVGRNTFKELMHGLKRGWTDPLDKVDKEAQLAHELELDGAFDEPNEPDVSPSGLGADGEPIPTPSRLQSSNTPVPIFSPLQAQMRAMDKPAAHVQQEDTKPNVKAIPAHLNAPPALIPRLPPLLLVAHTNLIGLSQIPHMLWDFVNERHRVRAGAEAGLRLVYSQTRPFIGPSTSIPASSETLVDPAASPDSTSLSIPTSDLDFDRLGESYYKSSLNDWPSEVEKARKTYYTELSKKLETARALARRTREPTKDELANPPPTEQELRQERMKKEQRWRADMKGWSIIKPDAEVEWDERFRDALSVFADPPSEEVNERTA